MKIYVFGIAIFAMAFGVFAEPADNLPRKVAIGTVCYRFEGSPEVRAKLADKLIDELDAKARKMRNGKPLDLVVLPEHAIMRPGKIASEKTVPLEFVNKVIGAAAKRINAYVGVGFFFEEKILGETVVRNAFALYDRKGALVGIYRKAHTAINWDDPETDDSENGISPGSDFPVFNTDFGKVGALICYDMSYPDGWRKLKENGAEIVVVSTMSPQVFRPSLFAHQYMYYVVTSAPRSQAAVIMPSGFPIASCTDQQTLVTEIDLSYILLHWSPKLEGGQRFDDALGKGAVGGDYRHEEDNGIFWSNLPDRSIGSICKELNLRSRDYEASRADRNASRHRVSSSLPSDPIRKDHPRMFFNKDTWPAIKAAAEGPKKEEMKKLLAACDTYPDNPVCSQFGPAQPREVKLADGTVKLIPPNPHTPVPSLREFGCQSACCALAWRFTGEKKYLDKTVKMLKANIEGYRKCYENGREVNWFSTTRILSLCAYDWIYEALTPEERREIIVPLLKHVEAAVDWNRFILRRNGGDGVESGWYGTISLAWYAGLAAYGDGFNDELAAALLAKGYSTGIRMIKFRNDGAGDDGSLVGCCPGYSLGAYPWAHFNFFHTYLSAFGHNLADDYPAMALYPNWVQWLWIPDPDDKTRPFQPSLGDSHHTSNRLGIDQLYEHLTQYIFFYKDSNPGAARLCATLRGLCPNREVGKVEFESDPLGTDETAGGFPFYPFLLASADTVEPYPMKSLEEMPLKARHFEDLGEIFMRSAWKPDATFACFSAGAKMFMHKHNDENSFTIFKHDPLALDTGDRARQMDFNLKYYYAQSVAHNTILIHKPGETLPWHWGPETDDPAGATNYGGQKSELPASVKAFETNPDFTYIASDAAACYGAKCKLALRQFVHVQPDVFVVYDRVVNDDAYKTEFLLHMQNDPSVEGRLLKADSRKGRLFCETLLPKDAKLELVGGDGNEFTANGKNWPLAVDYVNDYEAKCREEGRGPYWGRWRLEVKPANQTKETHFLNVLTATESNGGTAVKAKYVEEKGLEGVELDLGNRKLTFLFKSNGETGGEVTVNGARRPLSNSVQPQSGVIFK